MWTKRDTTEDMDLRGIFLQLWRPSKTAGSIYEAIEKSGRKDDTLFIILTDHGGIGHGHGGNDDKERLNSYIAVGKGLKSGKLESEDFHTATMAAVVLRALGVCQSDSCDFPVPEGYFA